MSEKIEVQLGIIDNNIQSLRKQIIQFVKNHDNFIYCDTNHDSMYAYAYNGVSEDERLIHALAVHKDHLLVFLNTSMYDNEGWTEEEIRETLDNTEEHEHWYTVASWGDCHVLPTIYSIAESIEQYEEE